MNVGSVAYRVYTNIPIFMKYRNLFLRKGSSSYMKKKSKSIEMDSDDWITEEDFINISFINNYILVELSPNPTDDGEETDKIIYMFIFSNTDTIEKETQTLKKLIHSLPESNEKEIIFISKNLMDGSRMNNLRAFTKFPLYNYVYRWLLSDPFDHVSVPPMRIINIDEEEELLGWIKKDKTSLPRIKITERINIFLNGKVGDIIEITRSSMTGELISYALIE